MTPHDLGRTIAQNEAAWRNTSPAERRAIRAGWAEAGWKVCPHDDCPPWDCRRREELDQ